LKIKYDEHSWQICVDLKMVNFLLGQQSGFTKFPCFLCHWDSRARAEHWERKEWPKRDVMVVGEKNVIAEPLVDRSKIIFPPLHIKLVLMKQPWTKMVNVLSTSVMPSLDLALTKRWPGFLMGPRSENLSRITSS